MLTWNTSHVRIHSTTCMAGRKTQIFLLLFFCHEQRMMGLVLVIISVPAGLGEAADAMVELCEMRGLKLNIYVGISI